MSWPRVRLVLRWSYRVFAFLAWLFALLIVLCVVVWVSTPRPSLEGIGNRLEVIESVSSGKGDFAFAVLGDTQKGIGSFRALLKSLPTVDFAIHTGDMVAKDDEGHWQLFLNEAQVRPLLAAVGNHDVEEGGARFDSIFGPRQFSFSGGNYRFVFLEAIDWGPFRPPWLEEELKRAKEPNILIFMHVPPFDPKRDEVVPREGWEPFFDLLDRYPVRGVFSGHIHEYRKKLRGQTWFVANGIGGDFESWALTTRAYATIVRVAGDHLEVETLSVPPRHGLMDNLRHFAVGHVGEALRRPVSWAVSLWLVIFLGLSLRRRRRKNRTPGEPSGPLAV